MAVTPKVANVATTFAPTANTRLGEGTRATAPSPAFAAISEPTASAEVGLENQGLRDDDWGLRRNRTRGRRPVSDSTGQSGGRSAFQPIRFGAVLADNTTSQVVFSVQLDSGPVAPFRQAESWEQRNREAADIYDRNSQVVRGQTRAATLGQVVSDLL